MQIGWISRRGRARLSNNDAAAFGRKDHYVVAMLVDAAERGDGAGLARYWSRAVIDAALGAGKQLSASTLIDIMRTEQQQLRHHHLHAIASYCCVLVDLQQQLLHIAHVGDCLAGIQRPAVATNWLNSPQNLPKQAIWPEAFQLPRESHHVLTRTLNARRFHSPDCLTTSFSKHARLVLCSDGYWHEHLHLGTDLQSVEDDASVLTLEYGEPLIELQSDCDNFREYGQPR